MAPQIYVGFPPAVINLVQNGLLERAFHDGLFPALLFRGEASFEAWDSNTGTEIFMTRPGTLAPITQAMQGNIDPEPQIVSYEQWVARLSRYSGAIDTHMPTSAVAAASLFIRNIQQLGLQAGQSLNRIPRNVLFQTYLSGQTVTIAAAASTDTSIRVASLNGFTDVISLGVNVRPGPVSSTNPLPVTLFNGGTAIALNVIGFNPDNSSDPFGPGMLLFATTIGAPVASRASLLSSAKPRVIRMGGGSSIDAIGAGDIFTLQGAINATNILRNANVLPHEDGLYHGHLNTDANGQTFQDPAWQRLFQGSKLESNEYQQAVIGELAGIKFFLNNETPNSLNCGNRTATGTNAFYSADIGAETTNESGVQIGRIVITGRGTMYEKGLDESAYVTEAGTNGKIGDFQIANNGVEISTERIKLILRAPQNRLQDQVSAAWSITTGFSCPSDVSSGGPARFKRAVVIEHALDG